MKGISPIVAVVLLLAMTVIAAVGIYFWALSLSSKQATPEAPTSIVVNPVGKGKLLIANLGQHSINTTNLKSTDSGVQLECESDTIPPGGQVLCTVRGSANSDTLVIYGNNTNPVIISGGNETVDNPPTISDLTDNSTDGEILLGDTLRVQAKASDDVGLKSVILHADNPSGDFDMQDVGDDIYVKDITPQVAGELNYYVKAEDTSNQIKQSEGHTVGVIQNWIRGYGGSSDYTTGGFILTDTDYIFAIANTNAFTNKFGILIMELNKSGNIVWAKVLNTSVDLWLTDAKKDGENIFILCYGNNITGSDTNIFLIKFNIDTYSVSGAEIGTSGSDISGRLTTLNDGSLLILSKTETQEGYYTPLVLHMSQGLGIIAAKTFNLTGYVKVGEPTNGNTYYILPFSTAAPFGTNTNYVGHIIRLYENLTVQSADKYTYTSGNILFYKIIPKDPTGVIVGDIDYNGTKGMLLIKISQEGDVNLAEFINGLKETYQVIDKNTSIVVSGKIGDNATIADVSNNGELLWAKELFKNGNDRTTSLTPETDGGYYVIGTSPDYSKMYVTKTNRHGALSNTCEQYNVDATSSITNQNITSSISHAAEVISTEDINLTTSSLTLGITDVTPTTTCVCQPFGCG